MTSSPFTGPGEPFTEKNRFAERFIAGAPGKRRALMITAAPSDTAFTEDHSFAIRHTMKLTGIEFEDYVILDDRNKEQAEELVRASDFIILGGGHAPTQNAFFAEIGLRELMKDFEGTVFGISAGSMNAADVVYEQPELEGEGDDPDFQKYLPGLDLTKTRLIPHYQEIRDKVLDGKRLFEDITCPDSIGKEFYALCDGSYLYSDGITERICGEAWLIKDSIIGKICEEGEEYCLK